MFDMRVRLLAGSRAFFVAGQVVEAGMEFEANIATACDLIDNARAVPADAAGASAVAQHRKQQRATLSARIEHEMRQSLRRVA